MIHHWNKAVGDKGDSMAVYGYIRVSARDQNEDRQLVAMHNVKVPKRNIYLDKQSGKDFERPMYRKLVQKLQKDDLIFVKSIDRLGRNYKEIQEQWQFLTRVTEVDIVVIDMPLLDTRRGKSLVGTLLSDIVLQVLAFAAENERDNIRTRQREGIDAAKAKGVKFGRPRVWMPENFDEICSKWRYGMITTEQAAQECGVSRSTLYKRYHELIGAP